MKKTLENTAAQTAVPALQEENSLYNETKLRRLCTVMTLMLVWLFLWALVLKLGSETLLVRNYTNLKDMTLRERILWDLIPFNYRGTDYWKMRQFIDTVLNCFVFAPFGVILNYVFKKPNLLRNAALCLLFSISVETMQMLTLLGNPATEDLITNVTGCFIGYALYRLVFCRLSTRSLVKTATVVNAFLVIPVIFSIITTANALDLIVQIITRTL